MPIGTSASTAKLMARSLPQVYDSVNHTLSVSGHFSNLKIIVNPKCFCGCELCLFMVTKLEVSWEIFFNALLIRFHVKKQ